MTVKVGPVSSSYRGKVVLRTPRRGRPHRRDRRHRPGRPRQGRRGPAADQPAAWSAAPGETEVTAVSAGERHRHPGPDGAGDDPGRQRPDVPDFSRARCASELESGAPAEATVAAASPAPPTGTAAAVTAVASAPSSAGMAVAVPASTGPRRPAPGRPSARRRRSTSDRSGARVAGRAAVRVLATPSRLAALLLVAAARLPALSLNAVVHEGGTHDSRAFDYHAPGHAPGGDGAARAATATTPRCSRAGRA